MFVHIRPRHSCGNCEGCGKLNHDEHRVWATQDLPLPTRAKNIFLFGLIWLVGEWGSDKRDKEIDERYDTMMITGNTVAKISSENGESEADWRSGWTEWGDIFLLQKFGQWRQFFFLACPQAVPQVQG